MGLGERIADRVRSLRDFVGLVYEKAADDNIFFLASGLTFAVFLAAIPFLILLLSVVGLLIAPHFQVDQAEVLTRVQELIPLQDPGLQERFAGTVEGLVQNAGSLGLASGVAFVWFSTRLFGALRTVLGEVFDLRETHGVIRGKLADVQMVLVSTVLLTVNVGLTSFLGGLGRDALRRSGVDVDVAFIQEALGFASAVLFIYLMFLLIFKFVPRKGLRWRTAAVAALVAALGFEAVKFGYGWFVANYADYSVAFFGIAATVVLVISVYYGCILFVLGGEVAQVYELRRTLWRQRELFEE